MPPKRRALSNRDLVDGMKYTIRSDGRKYYQYVHPHTGVCHGLGYDREQAISDARQANAILRPSGRLQRIVGQPTTLKEYLQTYREEVLPRRRIKGKPLSKRYLEETCRILDRIEEGLGPNRPINDIRQREIAIYLGRIESADASNQHRIRMVQVWRQAISDETITHGNNYPERIVTRDTEGRKRGRLTLEHYQEIYKHADTPIRCAMELSLNALQRRADIQKWRFDDQRDGFAHIIQSKTRKHGPSAWLRIPLSLPAVYSAAGARTLGELIDNCRLSDVVCPYLIHRKPEKLRRSKAKKHQFQLLPAAISNGFADARDAAGLFADLEDGEAPTFHELISLGQHLRKDAGWLPEQIQALRGHTKPETTEHYQEGHAWTTISL